MNSDKVISSLCYFSIFFAGFILPLVVYVIVKNQDVKRHAIHALISHIIPLVTILLIVVPFFFIWSTEAFAAITLLIFLVLIVVNIGVVIWNVVKGIQVLSED
ncbi:DUF4870 domain-containing protein [Fredinandcohnia humi]